MEGLVRFLQASEDKAFDDRAFIGMAVTMPTGEVEVLTEKVSQWRKWFQDGTIVTQGSEAG